MPATVFHSFTSASFEFDIRALRPALILTCMSDRNTHQHPGRLFLGHYSSLGPIIFPSQSVSTVSRRTLEIATSPPSIFVVHSLVANPSHFGASTDSTANRQRHRRLTSCQELSLLIKQPSATAIWTSSGAGFFRSCLQSQGHLSLKVVESFPSCSSAQPEPQCRTQDIILSVTLPPKTRKIPKCS